MFSKGDGDCDGDNGDGHETYHLQFKIKKSAWCMNRWLFKIYNNMVLVMVVMEIVVMEMVPGLCCPLGLRTSTPLGTTVDALP